MDIKQKIARAKRLRKPKNRLTVYAMIFLTCFSVGILIGMVFQTDKRPYPVVTLSMAYGSEKKKWINEITQDFQVYAFTESLKRYGIPLWVLCDFKPMGSRKMVLSTLTGEIQPTILSPASSIWIDYMNYKAMAIGGHPLINKDDPEWTKKVIYSPVVIGTWKVFNETWDIDGFDSLMKIPGRFAHTDPQLSNSGAMSLLMMVATFLEKDVSEIEYADLFNPEVFLKMSLIEKKCTYYGESTGFLGKKALDGTLDVFMVYESVIIDNNKKLQGGTIPALQTGGMVAVYPENGTLYSDHPFCIMAGDWVTPMQLYAAKLFLDFIDEPSTIEVAFSKGGFRPINASILNNPDINASYVKTFKESNGVQYKLTVPEFQGDVNPFILNQIPELWTMMRSK